MGSLQNLLQPKFPALKVIDGPVDMGRMVWLTGDRVVIGSDRSADLRLEGPGILPRHLILTRQVREKGAFDWIRDAQESAWVFSLEGDAQNTLNGATAPRSGEMTDKTVIGLGGYTRLALASEPVGASAPPEVQDAVRRLPVPMDDYWAYLALLVAVTLIAIVGGVFVVRDTLSAEEAPRPRSLFIDRMFSESGGQTMQARLDAEIARCSLGSARVTEEARGSLLHAKLLRDQGDRAGAANEMRRLDGILTRAGCPMLAAVRCDTVQLTYPGNRALHCTEETLQ